MTQNEFLNRQLIALMFDLLRGIHKTAEETERENESVSMFDAIRQKIVDLAGVPVGLILIVTGDEEEHGRDAEGRLPEAG